MSTKRSRKPDALNAITRADSIELLITQGIDLHARKLYLSGEVNEEMFKRCQNGLAVLNQMKPKDITVVLTTDGGCVYEAFGIHDLIKGNAFPVNIHTTGYCMSAGPIILQAGKKRSASENTQFMVHLGQEMISGEVSTVRKVQEHMKLMSIRMINILTKRADQRTEVESAVEVTRYFNSWDAEEMGLIDEVVKC
jgi:ATP-dependent Clp protease, protease subunit